MSLSTGIIVKRRGSTMRFRQVRSEIRSLNKLSFDGMNRRCWGFGGGGESDKSSAEAGIKAAGQGITEASKMTGPESDQYQRSFQLGQLMDQIMRYQQGVGAKPEGYLSPEQQYLQQSGPLGQEYYNQTLAGTKDPYAAYESSLQPALSLASQQINAGAANRGLLRSGIPIEQMGRAGVDLAIKEAQDRMNFRSQELARGGQLTQYSQNLGQQNLANMGNLYGQQQGYGLQAMNRQAQGASQAAPYYAYPYQAQLGDVYGSKGTQGAGIGGGLGTLMGANVGGVGGFFVGGPAGVVPGAMMGAGVGGKAGSELGRSIF